MTAPDWPDLESLLVKVLPQRVAVDGVSTVTPPTLDGKRWLRVTYGPGSESTVDESVLMDVEAFAPSRVAAKDLAEQARAAMHDLPASTAPLVDRVEVAVRPAVVPYGNPGVFRCVASYRVTVRPI